jgi:low temperature requirement protein LtrA
VAPRRRNDPERHATAIRYVTGTAAVQAGWLARLALPQTGGVGFAVLVIAELAVPLWAERREQTSWHPHHIAERYGLFTIIVLGECVLAATTAVGAQSDGHLGGVELLVVALGGLTLLFALWWLYFLKPAGEALAQRRSMAFWWGYGHYGIFAATAALGAALEAAAERAQHLMEASDSLIGWAVAAPVAIFVALVWGLHAPLGAAPTRDVVPVLSCVVAVLAAPAVTLAGVSSSWVVVLTAVPVVALVAFAGRRHLADPSSADPSSADQPNNSPGMKA